MPTGTVKFLTTTRFWFYHAREWWNGCIRSRVFLQRGDSLREGDKVSFEIGQDRKTGKSKAENVSVL